MKALRFERSLPRFAAARLAGSLAPGAGGRVGPLRLADIDEPGLPGPDWVRIRPRLAGICGSDLATIDATSSRWFEPIVSFPFIPGHEIVGDLDDGQRVVIEPVLGCAARAITPRCTACADGDVGRCTNITVGALAAGLQTGYCADTGGGWSTELVAHRNQVHAVPDELSDEAAVMVEPTACALRGALKVGSADTVVVIGAGTLGLCATAALAWLPAERRHLIVAAKHADQRHWARVLGATTVVEPGELIRAVRRATGTSAVAPGPVERLAGGVDVVLDCVGSPATLAQALAITRPGGRVVMIGMPGQTEVDLTPLWQREIELVGAYAYGREPAAGGRRTFDLAFELVAVAELGRLVSAAYPLSRYAEALRHAAEAGTRGAVKVVFDLRDEAERERPMSKESPRT